MDHRHYLAINLLLFTDFYYFDSTISKIPNHIYYIFCNKWLTRIVFPGIFRFKYFQICCHEIFLALC